MNEITKVIYSKNDTEDDEMFAWLERKFGLPGIARQNYDNAIWNFDINDDDSINFYFKNPDHATEFKLVWG